MTQRRWFFRALAVLTAGSAGWFAFRQWRSAQPRPAISLNLPIRSRAEWNAQPPNHAAAGETGFYDPLLNPGGWRVYTEPLDEILRNIAVHHSATAATDGPARLQQVHFKNQRFADIGYHFVIDQTGVIWEGRPLSVRGASVARNNTGTVGICLVGNFEAIKPSEAQLASLVTLSGALRHALGITHFGGHGDFPGQDTRCPGANLKPLLPDIAQRLGLTPIT
jgi:N-acetylmuramoyl-L-alanine amidase